MSRDWKWNAIRLDMRRPDGAYAHCDTVVLVEQIGTANVFAISGGRIGRFDTGVVMPVARGYWVTVNYVADDTYTVRRVFYRGDTVTVHYEVEGVHADQVGEVAYRASLWEM